MKSLTLVFLIVFMALCAPAVGEEPPCTNGREVRIGIVALDPTVPAHIRAALAELDDYEEHGQGTHDKGCVVGVDFVTSLWVGNVAQSGYCVLSHPDLSGVDAIVLIGDKPPHEIVTAQELAAKCGKKLAEAIN
jgi:hypothetical protein